MNILLIEADPEARNVIYTVLQRELASRQPIIVSLKLIQDGIEMLEKQTQRFDLIVFAYSGTGQALVKCLIDLGGNTNYIMCVADPSVTGALTRPELTLEHALRTDLPRTLPIALKNLASKRSQPAIASTESDFVAIEANTLFRMRLLRCDVYIRLSENRFVKLIKKGDALSSDDRRRMQDERRAESLFVHKSDIALFLTEQSNNLKLAADAADLTEAEGERVSTEALESVANLVERVGFTTEAQNIAKQSVDITLKLLGARPKLSVVLSRLKTEEGKYIASHSITLGKISCALAYKIGWNSAATYLKLTLAAFLHDLPLKNNDLASYTSYEEVRRSKKFSDEEANAFRFHPMKAAEYAKQFSEIPPDVDQILAQHHERPDGTGFPRGLTSKHISPLSCLFIIAHDLLHYMLGHPNAPIEVFFDENKTLYSTGNFKKIFLQLTDASSPQSD